MSPALLNSRSTAADDVKYVKISKNHLKIDLKSKPLAIKCFLIKITIQKMISNVT